MQWSVEGCTDLRYMYSASFLVFFGGKSMRVSVHIPQTVYCTASQLLFYISYRRFGILADRHSLHLGYIVEQLKQLSDSVLCALAAQGRLVLSPMTD